MKRTIRIWLLLFLPALVQAQNLRQIDSAYGILQQASNDTVRMQVHSLLGSLYDDINADSGLYHCEKGIAIAQKLELPLHKAEMLAFMSWPLMKTGNYPEALRVINQGMQIAEDPSAEMKEGSLPTGTNAHAYRLRVIGLLYTALESIYIYVGDYEKQVVVAREAITRLEAAKDTFNLAGLYPDMGYSYLQLNKPDSALYYQQRSLYYYSLLSYNDRKFEGGTYINIGAIYEKKGNIDLARENYQKAVQVSEQHDNPRHAGTACLELARLYRILNRPDSGFLYAQKALAVFSQAGYKKEVAMACRMIAGYYEEKNNTDSSFAYLKRAITLDDSLDRIENAKLQEFRVAAFNQQLAVRQQEQERVKRESRLRTIALLALVAVFATVGSLLYRNNRQKQKANRLLQEKNEQVEQALRELKATQKQLIQSEKMASLGELTAGIAHEIQNPLNFVNNFSELNKELAEELKQELATGNWQQAKEIADDIMANEEKINHHGKRADAIVKGMLQHSRSSSGQKEPTDLNALCDEYLRLAYHGLRAKDKSFNAAFRTELDDSIGKVNVMPQEMGRVILNLINNAFYAVSAKALASADRRYEPLVTVTTRKAADKVEIRITDNGTGIPEKVLDKIFQPFFTTKPTGEGTGLGLSLSYDIVTKGHGGELTVETRQGEGTTFTIQLPKNQTNA